MSDRIGGASIGPSARARGVPRRLGASALALAVTLGSWAAHAGDLRGALTGGDALTPAAAPEAGPRPGFYWEEPNGALETRRPRANVEFDLGVVLTGPNVPEASQPVAVPVTGGRCRPGTVVLGPNATLRVQNQDWIPREFYVAPAGSSEPVSTFAPEATAPRSERQGQVAQAGRYELRDRRAPTFRCFVLVGEGQGRLGRVAPDGTYTVPLPANADGAYTVRAYFEGRSVGEQQVRVTGGRDAQVPAIAVNAAGGDAPGAGASAAPSAGASAAPSAPPAAENPAGRRRGGR